jgi:hypothetical protein
LETFEAARNAPIDFDQAGDIEGDPDDDPLDDKFSIEVGKIDLQYFTRQKFEFIEEFSQ